MAESGSIFTSRSNTSAFYLQWQLADQDIPNNRSLIKWQAGLDVDGNYYWYSNAVKINSIYVNGGGSLGSGTWSNIYGPTKQQLKSGSVWITHNSDGSKSFGADISGWLFDFGNKSASGSWSLPTIPRNSQVDTDASSYSLGDAIKIITNRKSSSFTHTITIRMDNSGGTVLQTINSVGSSVTWTPSSSQITTMQNHIPESNTLTLYIDQYNNQVKEHSHVSITLKLTDANPTFTDFAYKDSDSTTVGVTGDDQVLVKGKSVLEVDISTANKMVAIKGASEDHYAVAYDGVSHQEDYSSDSQVSASFDDVLTFGTRTIQVTAYDSRNNATKVTKNVTVYDYLAPTIVTTLTRENNFGSNTTIHIEGTYTPLVIGGSAKNSLQTGTLQYRYKEDGGSFGSWTTKTFTDNGDGTFDVTDFVVSLDNTKKYDFEFHIDDSFGTITTTNSVDTGNPIMFVGQNDGDAAVGINKMPENGALDVSGDVYADSFAPSAGVMATVAFSVWSGSSGSLTGGSSGPIGWPNVDYDIGSNFTSTTAGSTSGFTVPYDGVYHFDGSIEFSPGPEHIQTEIFVNGSIVKKGNSWDFNGLSIAGQNGGFIQTDVSCDLLLSAGDFVQCGCFNDDTANLSGRGQAYTYFNGHLIGLFA